MITEAAAESDSALTTLEEETQSEVKPIEGRSIVRGSLLWSSNASCDRRPSHLQERGIPRAQFGRKYPHRLPLQWSCASVAHTSGRKMKLG
jgi:hypothetical protein